MKSVKGQLWEIQTAGKISREEIVRTLLINRGHTTKALMSEFLSPKAPLRIAVEDFGIDKEQLAKAVNRIQDSVRKKEKIIIYGDYDADGITASGILWEALYSQGANVTPYIPDRFSEGYGINSNSVKLLKAQNPDLSLIITVDNGIVAVEAARAARELGIDVIITDHHEVGAVLPPAHAIVHTKQTSGSGVSWLLARELNVSLAATSLELAAIGTLADQLPLVGVNRSLVSHGIKALNATSRVGLVSLLTESGIKIGEVTTYSVGFVIAPRINAMGRLAHGLDSLRLLCTKSARQAAELTKLVGKTNKDRQKIVDELVTHAKGEVVRGSGDGFIVVWHESYHEGVIGLVASKLVEEYGRPAIVLANGGRIAKASARSIPGINIIEAINKLNGLLLAAGGHEMAAGFSVKSENLEKLKAQFGEISSAYLDGKNLEKRLNIDLEADFIDLNFKLLSELKKFEPFGQGNRTPIFTTTDVEVLDKKIVGRTGDHLKLKLKKGKKTFEAIGFGLGEHDEKLNGNRVNVAYSVEENVWKGNWSMQLNIRDIAI